MNADEFAEIYPTAYHMTDETAWPSIRRHGLLSTRAAVEMFRPSDSVRAEILEARRLSSVTLQDDSLGSVTIRDQRPLKFLAECLHEGIEPQQFLDALNARVYFWLSSERLNKLLNARAYRNRRHLVLHVDTTRLMSVYQSTIELAPYNTGSAHVPTVPKRGPDVFTPMADYPFDAWRKRRGRNGEHVVELTVPYAVPDIARFVRQVEIRDRDLPPVPLDVELSP
jgi:hypothetical protein